MYNFSIEKNRRWHGFGFEVLYYFYRYLRCFPRALESVMSESTVRDWTSPACRQHESKSYQYSSSLRNSWAHDMLDITCWSSLQVLYCLGPKAVLYHSSGIFIHSECVEMLNALWVWWFVFLQLQGSAQGLSVDLSEWDFTPYGTPYSTPMKNQHQEEEETRTPLNSEEVVKKLKFVNN